MNNVCIIFWYTTLYCDKLKNYGVGFLIFHFIPDLLIPSLEAYISGKKHACMLVSVYIHPHTHKHTFIPFLRIKTHGTRAFSSNSRLKNSLPLDIPIIYIISDLKDILLLVVQAYKKALFLQ